MPANQTSDDCASLNIKESKILINTDLMVEETHFNDQIMCPRDIGWKAVITNYSDLISSGCVKNIGINIGLVLSCDTEWEWVDELYRGISESLKIYGGSILGGDVARGNNNIISITAFGIQGKLELRRYACKPREILFTTGVHGLSKLGFLLKKNEIKNKKNLLTSELIDNALDAFCKPTINNDLINQILITKNTNDKFEIGCTDSSDGFYQSILDLTHESNCKAIIDYKKIPKNKEWPTGKEWDSYYFFGGEDYELIFSLPQKWADRLKKINNSVTEIGYLEEGEPSVELQNYKSIDLNLLKKDVFSHF